MPEVVGESETGHGVVGIAHADAGFGVYGQGGANTGVVGESAQGHGVAGLAHSATGIGVYGKGEANSGVVGESDTAVGVFGQGPNSGVLGESQVGHGVVGRAHGAAGFGVYGKGIANTGVVGESDAAIGVYGRGPTGGRFEGGSGPGVEGISLLGNPAGRFDGNVVVTGDVQLAGADLAEEFGVVGERVAEPGCVVVLAGDDQVRVCDEAYDRRVAGVVSGAGTYRPALILDRKEGSDRRPLALTGKVWCNVEADSAPIALGDLLTTSVTPGHAMRAADPARAFGAVIGKALGSLDSGRGLLPVLVALQ